MLHTIAYISEIVVELRDGAIGAIVNRSFTYKDQARISQILSWFSDRFIQVLEGLGSAVGQLCEKIRLDPRHGNVVTVQDTSIEERAYGGWGCVGLEQKIRASQKEA